MIQQTKQATCDLCGAQQSFVPQLHVPPGWWELSVTEDNQRCFVRCLCARCWKVFEGLFPHTTTKAADAELGRALAMTLSAHAVDQETATMTLARLIGERASLFGPKRKRGRKRGLGRRS